ncbi:MAG: glutamate--tRNA ligase, partial [Pseudomonadota bacterium]
PARFSMEELRQLNAKVLHETPYSAVSARLDALGVSEALWSAVRGNLERLEEASEWAQLVENGAEPVIAEEDAEFVAQAMALLPERPWDETTWKSWTDAVKSASGRKGKALFMPLRKALTGRERGPEMAALLPLLENVPAAG